MHNFLSNKSSENSNQGGIYYTQQVIKNFAFSSKGLFLDSLNMFRKHLVSIQRTLVMFMHQIQ